MSTPRARASFKNKLRSVKAKGFSSVYWGCPFTASSCQTAEDVSGGGQAGDSAQSAVASQACLKNLSIHLGPELRTMYPFIVNLGLSGDIELNGPADPTRVCVAGTITLDSGEVRQTSHSHCVDCTCMQYKVGVSTRS